MKFLHFDLGYRESGEVAQVSLSGNQANVRLMDSLNFQKYKNGRGCKFYGGIAQKSKINMEIPHSGTWYIVVDMNGLRGKVNATVEI